MPGSVFPRRPAPDNLPPPEHWGAQAACRKAPPAVFFPEDFGAGEAKLYAEEAKSYCRRCPVVEPCLRQALEQGEEFGVWGGIVAAERRAALRRARKEASGGSAHGVPPQAA